MRLVHPRLLIATAALAACNSAVVPPPDPAELVVLKAAPSLVTPGSIIEEISVRLLSATGEPVSGYLVEWSGDGTIEPLNARTDDLGVAHARWQLPYWTVSGIGYRPGPSGDFEAQAATTGLPAARLVTTARSFRVDQVDASSSYACGTRVGELWCWGRGAWPLAPIEFGEVPQRVPLPAGVQVQLVRATYGSVCVLDAEGIPRCTTYLDPQPFAAVVGAPALLDLAKGEGWISGGGQYCGRAAADQSAWCWDASDGAVGMAHHISTRPFAAVQAGGEFGCGLGSDATVWCWGANDAGQLGNGTNSASSVPVQVLQLPPVVTLSANGSGACAAEASGQIWCWGFGPHGYASNVPVPITVPGIHGTHVVVSGSVDGYLIAAGRVRVWYGSQELDLFTIAGHIDAVEVTGDGQTCVRSTTSEVYCSWILLRGGGDTSPFPSDLLPVRDPASGQGN